MRKKLGNLEKEEPGLRLSDEAISDLFEQKTDVLRDVRRLFQRSSVMNCRDRYVPGIFPQSGMKWNIKSGQRTPFRLRYSNGHNNRSILIVETETVNEEATQAGIELARAPSSLQGYYKGK